MNNLNASGIAFIAFTVCCTMLEIFGNGANGLWVIVVMWAIFGEFERKE